MFLSTATLDKIPGTLLIEFVVFRLMLLAFFLWGILRLLGMDFGFTPGEYGRK